MNSQKHLFNLNNDSVYLNGAYMSPQLKSVEIAGVAGLLKKSNPSLISGEDFFSERIMLKKSFARLIQADDFNNIAIIPSVSYGIANVARNLSINKDEEILVVDDQFPSNVYSWKKLAQKQGAILRIIKAPADFQDRAKQWNDKIINAINTKTALVAISHVHWADGTRFDLKSIGELTQKYNAKLLVDGTQSVGALDLSLKEFKIDALICAGYKWLMGPYSLGLAYYSSELCKGEPIEENWINRLKSEDFAGLTNYQDQYQAGAERFSVGESSNFIQVPMLNAAINQILEWGPDNIQSYCHKITKNGIASLRDRGCNIEDDYWRGSHLFGVYLNSNMNSAQIKKLIKAEKISVSYRADAIRVSPHVYNTENEFLQFVELIK